MRGIVNGTTNFILSAMTDETAPLDFAAALAEAQRLGYAEADPSGDIEGLDAVNKLVILARLAFDRWLDPAAIPTRPDGADGPAGPGIATVSLADQEDARAAGRIIRLVATGDRAAPATAGSRLPCCRRRSRSILPSAGRPASATGSRSTRCPSGVSGSTARARAAPRRQRGPRRSDRDRARRGLDVGTAVRRRPRPAIPSCGPTGRS